MSGPNRTQVALERARQAFPSELDADPGGTELERVDRVSDGLLLTFRAGRGFRWVRCQVEPVDSRSRRPAVELLSLQRDASLPISPRLAEVAREGPLEVLSYRPGRRLVLRQGSGASARILKAFRKNRFEASVRAHVTAALAVEGTALHVPPITARNDELAYVTMRDLGRRSLRLERLSPEWFARVGRSLAAFQRLEPDVGLSSHGLTDELDVIERQRASVEYLVGELPSGFEEARAGLERALEGLEERHGVLTHRDFHDGQLMPASGGPGGTSGIGLLDFDLLCLADPALDAANLTAHLELRVLQGGGDAAPRGAVARGAAEGITPTQAAAFSRALLEAHGTDAADPRFRFLRAATFLRLALVYRLRPRWAHLAPELVRRAELCFEEVPRSVS